ncbi:MAG: glycosyltransferase [Luteolibacter sp.]
MKEATRVAAVFATMNRSETARRCVESLAAQTRPPERVIVADNVSSDDTVAILEDMRDLPFPLTVLKMAENAGNAGGVRAAMELGFEEGADAVWILDDDSWPRSDALAELLHKPLDPSVVRHSVQIDPKTGRFTWPMQIFDQAGKWVLVDRLEEIQDKQSIRTRIMWTGALLPRQVRERIGPVNGDLFIRGEDEEYPWRIEQAGFTQEAATRSILDHPGPERLVEKQFLGKRLFFEPGLSDWKLYYKIRNMVWLKKQQSGMISSLAMAAAYGLITSRIDGLRRIPLVIEASIDGWRGRLGKWKKH